MESFDTTDKSLITNSKGISYLDFRNALKPRYSMVWLHIFSGYTALLVVLVMMGLLQKFYAGFFWLSIPVGGILIGYIIAYIHLFMHEASHYNIALGKKQNDLLANVFIGLLVGLDIKFYRAMHAAHHRYLGTTKDTEKSYFDPITARFVIETLTGIRVIKVLMHRNENMKLNEGTGAGSEIIKRNQRMFIAAALLNLAVIVFFFLSGYWQVALAWLMGVGAIFPFFAAFRQVLEHRREEAVSTIDYSKVDQGASHRMFGVGLISSTMGPAGFNRHLLHHWDPQVSYTRLKDVEEYLMDTSLGSDMERSRTTYFKTFMALLNK